MIKKKVLALILAAATALTSFSAIVFADGETTETESAQKKRVLLYREDFESENPEIYIFGNYDNKKTAAASNQFRTVSETDNKAGAFYITDQNDTYQRVGYQFSDDGITSGEMDVKFRFKQGSGSTLTWSHVLLGDNNKKGSLMQLLCYDKSTQKNPAIKILDDSSKVLLNPIAADTWYKYEATVDLSSHKMTASLKDNDDFVINMLADIAVPNHGKEFQNWPVDGYDTKFKMFGVANDMIVDDIEIYCDPIEVTDFQFDESAGGQLTFNHNAAAVLDGAVKIGEENVSGALSEDGKTCTFDIPSNLIGGKEYTVTVDQSKIKMKAVQASADTGDNLYGKGTKTYTFTPTEPEPETPYVRIYHENFEGENPEIYVFGDTDGELEGKPTGEDQFKVAQDTGNPQNSTRYGSFFSGGTATDWKRVGYQFSEKGIKTGKMRVKFKFRSNDGPTNWGAFFLGNNITRWNWLSCVSFDKNGPVKILNRKGAETNFLDTYESGTWYSYEATLDLDKESIDASLYTTDGALIKNLKWSANGTKRPVDNKNQPFYDWPNNWAENEDGSPFSIKSFAAYTNLDLDDIEIYAEEIINIEAASVDFINAEGEVYSQADALAKKARITFDMPIDSVENGAVTLGDVVCPDGELSEDGKTYTVSLPEELMEDKEYTLTVDYTKITKYKSSGEAVLGTGSKEFKFTPVKDEKSYSQDFETDGVQFYAMGNSGLGAAVTDETKYSQKTDENGNKYARFCEGGIDWARRGIRFNSNGVTSGKIDLHFDFRPNSATFESGAFGAALIGNCDKKYNWLSALRIAEDGRISAGNLSVSYPFLTQNGEYANVKNESADGWYTYDAVIDLDTRSADMKITNRTSGEIYTLTLSGMMIRDGDKDEWGEWPHETLFKDIAALGAIDLDNISIKEHEAQTNEGAEETENEVLKLTVEDGKVTAQLKEYKDGVMLLAQYGVDNTLIKLQIESVPDGNENFEIKADIVDNAERFKAFVWNSLEEMKPLAPALAYPDKMQEYKVLVIGNSFADDSIYYLHPVAAADGVVITATNCYYGGRPLATHANRMRTGQADYQVKRPGYGVNGIYSSQFALELDDWDVVAVQGTTHMSDGVVYDKSLWEDKAEDWETIRDKVKELAPNAKRLTHMTWAPHEIRAELFADKYEDALINFATGDDLRTAYLKSVIPHYEFGSKIYSSNAGEMIPTGIAVEYALTHFDGYFKEHEEVSGDDSNGGKLYNNFEGTHALYRDDTCHMSYTGRILASLVWYETITGNSALDNKFVGFGLDEEAMQKLREAAHYACETYKHYLN